MRYPPTTINRKETKGYADRVSRTAGFAAARRSRGPGGSVRGIAGPVDAEAQALLWLSLMRGSPDLIWIVWVTAFVPILYITVVPAAHIPRIVLLPLVL